MRILILGNPHFRQDFEDMGHQVKCVTFDLHGEIRVPSLPTNMHCILSLLPQGWYPDLVIVADQSTHPLILGLEWLDVPLVWYAIDTHVHYVWHPAYASVFDVILVAQKDYLPMYLYDASRQVVVWAPLFCDPAHDRVLRLPRDYPLSFVGTVDPKLNPDRVTLLKELQQRLPIVIQSGPYVETFNRSKIVLNQCVANDVNFRTFQAMACGTLLLMEQVGNGLTDLFQNGIHLVLYDKGNIDQIVELSEHYLVHDADRAAIAERGREIVVRNHTSRHRAQQILELIASHDLHCMISKRKSRLIEIEHQLARVYQHAADRYYRAATSYAANPELAHSRRAIGDRYASLATTIRNELGPCMNRT